MMRRGMNWGLAGVCAGLAAMGLSACAQEAGETASAPEDAEETAEAAQGEGAAAGPVRPNPDPFPSTYRPYPSETVLITGATLLTGTGARIDDGAVLMQDGRIAAVGAADAVTAPAGASVIEADGKWVTPGVIDIHSHLGN